MSAKENLLRRLKALLAKTVENGASEAEAMSALAKAQEIMQAHGLSQEAIEAEAFVEQLIEKRAARKYAWHKDIAYGVGCFTGTYPYMREGYQVVFAGRETATMFAGWLCDALDGFVTRNALAYLNEAGGARATGTKRSVYVPGQADMFGSSAVVKRDPETDYQRQQRLQAFAIGVCQRVTQRLRDLSTTESMEQRRLAQKRLEEQGMSFQQRRSHGPDIRDRAAYEAGQRVGDKATFNRPVGGGAGGAPLQIGRA